MQDAESELVTVLRRNHCADQSAHAKVDPDGRLPIVPIVVGVVKLIDIAITANDVRVAAKAEGVGGAAKELGKAAALSATPGEKMLTRFGPPKRAQAGTRLGPTMR